MPRKPFEIICEVCGNSKMTKRMGQRFCSYECSARDKHNTRQCSDFDTRFFERDTPTVAYWAGFIYADGSLLRHGKYYSRIDVAIQTRDKDHLKKLREDIGALHLKIRDTTNSSGFTHGKPCLSSEISIIHQDLSLGLERWGIVPNKTYAGKTPTDIPEGLVPHFLRGLIDGDGSLGLYACKSYADPRPTIEIACTRTTANWVSEHSIIKPYISSRYKRTLDDGSEWELVRAIWNGFKKTKPLLRWLGYADDVPSLDRKKERALLILQTEPVGVHHGPDGRFIRTGQ